MYPYLLTAIFAFLATCALTPAVRLFAQRKGYLDRPDATRKLHKQPKPLGGGVAIFLAILVAVSIGFLSFSKSLDLTAFDAQFLLGLLIASTIILITGVLDDLVNLSGLQKLFGQAIAVAVFMSLEPTFDHITAFGIYTSVGFVVMPFVAFWLLGAINSVNLLDGADGIASTVGVIVVGTSAVMAMYAGHTAEALVAMATVGALLGFLLFNFPPSSIFLGDAGSMLIGLLVGVLAIRCHVKEATTVALIGPIALMAIPIIDSTAAIIRRLLTGKNIFDGDHAHLHHMLQRRGLSPKSTVVAVAVLCLIPAFGTIASGRTNNSIYALISGALVLTVLVTFSFFRNEFNLVVDRTRQMMQAIYPTVAPSDQESAHCLGLEQSKHAEEIWDALISFSGNHNISKLRFHLSGDWMRDGNDVVCVSRANGVVRKKNNWNAQFPLSIDENQVGSFSVAGNLNETATGRILSELNELFIDLAASLEAIGDARTKRENVRDSALFINRSYWPDCEATGQLLTDLCERVAEEMNVTVIAGKPNENPESADFIVGGVEKKNGVTIRRVQHTKLPKRSMTLRAVNLLSFLFMATWEAFRTPKHDVVVVETDPFLLPLLGAELKRWSDCKLIIYVQDIYPDVAVAIGKVREGFLTRTIRSLLLQAYQRADKIVVLGQDMKDRLVSHGVNPNRIDIIPNWVDTKAIYPIKENNAFRIANNIDDKFVVMHSGNMGLTQGLESLMDVAEKMQHREDIVFVLAGGGVMKPRLTSEVNRRGLKNVRILPYQPRSELATSLSAADLHVVSMHPNICGVLVPSKIYGIMASATPVLAIVPPDSDIADLVDSTTTEKIGFVVDALSTHNGDISHICQILDDCVADKPLLKSMGSKARERAQSDFDTETATASVLRLLHETLPARRGRKTGLPVDAHLASRV